MGIHIRENLSPEQNGSRRAASPGTIPAESRPPAALWIVPLSLWGLYECYLVIDALVMSR